MSWLKLEIIKYDISYIKNYGFTLGFNSKSIKDYNFNDIINVPLLINGNYDLYKIEIEISNNLLYIYMYLNYKKFVNIIRNNSVIPFRNEIFEILKYNSKKFKMNEKYFEQIQKYIYNKKQVENIVDVYPSLKNTCFEYKNIVFNLEKQKLYLKNKYNNYYLQSMNIYLFIDIFENIGNIIKNKLDLHGKCLFIYDSKQEKDFLKKLDFNILDINTNNYHKYLFNDLTNSNLIMISTKLIKSKKYWGNYHKYHSVNNLEYAYENFSENLSYYKKNNLKFYNIELITFNHVISLNNLSKCNMKNNYFNFFLNKLKFKSKTFIETSFEINFNYSYFKCIKKYLFDNDVTNDIGLNLKFLTNNTFIYSDLNNKTSYNTITVNRNKNLTFPSKFYKYNLFLFEYILETKFIKYSINNNAIKNVICPITYQSSNNVLFVQTCCNHHFSFIGFMQHLLYSNKCPICSKNISQTNLEIKGNCNNIRSIFLGEYMCNDSLIIVDDYKDSLYLNRRIAELNNLQHNIFSKFIDVKSLNSSKNYTNRNVILYNNFCNNNIFEKKKKITFVNSLLKKDTIKNFKILSIQ